MGDFKFSVNNSVGPISAVEFQPNTKNSIFCTTPTVTDTVQSSKHSAMQDDLLIEKPAVKAQQQISPNPEVNGDKSTKTKEDDHGSGKVSNNNISLNGKQNDPLNTASTVSSSSLQISQGYNASESNINVVNTSSVSQASVWPSGSVEDGMLQNLAAHGVTVNGTLAFQNFQPNNLYNHLGNQITGITQNQGQSAQQRRPITGQHNFPPNIGRQIQNHPPPNLFLTNKGYGAPWSSPQQNPAWGTPQNQSNVPGAPWNRGRSVPNINPALQNMNNFGNMGNRKPSPTFNQQHQMVQISPIKFRRSTSYPGKTIFPQHPTFEITGMDDNRDNLLYQVSAEIKKNSFCH